MINNMFICFSNIEFKCPHCKTDYDDRDDFYYNRFNKNKCGYTKVKCSCGERFGVTSDMKGDLVGFEL